MILISTFFSYKNNLDVLFIIQFTQLKVLLARKIHSLLSSVFLGDFICCSDYINLFVLKDYEAKLLMNFSSLSKARYVSMNCSKTSDNQEDDKFLMRILHLLDEKIQQIFI